MATGAPVDVAAEELARGEAGQAEALSAEVGLVGVPHVDRQSGHAVRNEMNDDPVVFIIRDWRSQIVVAIGAVLLVAGGW